MRVWLVALALAVCLAAAGGAQAPLTVAAASDLQAALPDIAERFRRDTGNAVRLTFGSSGNFFAQIQNGAPFDLFFSADVDYPRRLEQAGLAEPGSVCRYAIGRIVLWTRHDSGVDLGAGLPVLASARVRKVAIANPEHAPYGKAAVAALQSQNLYERVRAKLVLGENISQAAQFAESGNADAGIVALALALSPALQKAGRYYEIPPAMHPPIEQAAVIVRASPRKALARQFLAFVQSPAGEQMLRERGFARP